MAPISRAVPGTERKRTRLKAPATATPAPTLPLTIIMTTQTTAGRVASVTAKPALGRVRHSIRAHRIRPMTRDAPTHRRNCSGAIVLVSWVSKTPRNIVSSIPFFSFVFLLQQDLIGRSVLGEGGLVEPHLRQQMDHPQGDGPRGFQLHQHLIRT